MTPTEEQTYREGVTDRLDEILTQVKKTNGRVRSLEIWRGFIIGGLAVITALVIPILIVAIKNHI